MPNITTNEAAETLGVSVRTVHRMVTAGELNPVTKLPGLRGAYLFRDIDVRRIATRRTRRTAA